MRVPARVAILAMLPVLVWTAVAAQETREVFQGPAAEEFLLRARFTRIVDINIGVTAPQKVTLQRDGVTRMALFKTIDVQKTGATPLADGTFEVAFQDSWRTEVAAYEVDKTIGLGMVPATVRRTIRSKDGSLQWWVESMMPEAQRVRESVRPPDAEAWNNVMYKMRLFDRLIYNTDRHLNNVLVTSDFDLRLIDHSRSFRPFDEVQTFDGLTKFSRSLLEGMTRLEFADLKKRLGRYLSDRQIRALLARRDQILAHVAERVAAEGEAAVLYD
ncbi:MAG TPA: hypothetical protein VMM93_07815 [Vicinamibacterales bacterium]|nr:hypothetical protein [Vicinamibacterales bacterium]